MTGHGPWIDVHAHPGACFLRGLPPDDLTVQFLGGDRTDTAIAALVASEVTVSSFSTVADLAVLGPGPDGAPTAVRDFDDGEAVADHDRQLTALAHLGDSAELTLVGGPDEVRDLHAAGRSGHLVTCEGADFAEHDPGQIERAHARGVRLVTLVHYRPNEIGDLQTSPARHGGLSGRGRELVGELNRLGIVVDLAHASAETTAAAAETSTAPIVVSHSHLAAPGRAHPRLLEPFHARLVAETGGVVGAWPAGIVAATLADFADEVCRLIDLLGVDHVAIGSDLDANYRPVLDRHAQFTDLAGLLGGRGLTTEEIDAVLGGNFLRVWQAVEAAAG